MFISVDSCLHIGRSYSYVMGIVMYAERLTESSYVNVLPRFSKREHAKLSGTATLLSVTRCALVSEEATYVI